jgi:hypothetical protein
MSLDVSARYGRAVTGSSTNRVRAEVAGTVLTVLGGAAVLVAFVGLNWLPQHNSTLSDVHDRLTGLGHFASGMSELYFAWLAWVLFGALLVVAVLANLPVPGSRVLGLFGTVLALAAIALSFWALNLLTTGHPGYSDYLRNARGGFYVAVSGFLVMGLGAAIGAYRRARD